jgi:hypothetical protein
MTRGMRWRVFVLQVGLIGILGFVAGFLFWGNSFVHNMVTDELTAQKITFPAAGSTGFDAKTLGADHFATISQYAGQDLTTGPQAQSYANDYINVHLQGVAKGQTYSQVSAAYIASGSKDATLAGQRTTLFQGETLRGLLLNAYGWWTVGQYAFYAAIGLTVAAFAVFAALVFEILAMRRQNEVTKKVTAGRPALAGGGN